MFATTARLCGLHPGVNTSAVLCPSLSTLFLIVYMIKLSEQTECVALGFNASQMDIFRQPYVRKLEHDFDEYMCDFQYLKTCLNMAITH